MLRADHEYREEYAKIGAQGVSELVTRLEASVEAIGFHLTENHQKSEAAKQRLEKIFATCPYNGSFYLFNVV